MFFFLLPRLEHPAGWICARYKSLLLLLLLLCIVSSTGSEVLSSESLPGATQFVKGKGRGGSFETKE